MENRPDPDALLRRVKAEEADQEVAAADEAAEATEGEAE